MILREIGLVYKNSGNKAPPEWKKEATSSRDLERVFRPIMDIPHEQFVVVFLTSKHSVIGYSAWAGGLAACAVNPVDVLRRCILSNSAAICLMHNHPSGDPKPSAEDVAFTKKIADFGTSLGIRVLDHIIFASDSYYSFLDNGVM
jgi:DNA repair protein RadC